MIINNSIEYHKYIMKHLFCPNCESDNVSHTCVGHFVMDANDFIDNNKAICGDCGFSGIVHDLIGKELVK